MRTRVIAASAIVALMLAGVASVAFAHRGLLGPQNSSDGINFQNGDAEDHQDENQTASLHTENETEDALENEGGLNFTIGRVLTFSNLTGHCNNLTLTIGTRDNGPKFQDVTSQLTNVCTVALGCIPLFNSALTSYFWSYDNQGNKVLQLRFYPSA